MVRNLTKSALLERITVDGTNYQAATGQDGAAVNSGIIDTLGYAGLTIMFLRGNGTAANVLTVKLQSGDNSALSDAADVTGTSQTVTDVSDNKDNRMVCYDVFKPKKRYWRVVYQRTTQNSPIDGIVVIKHLPSHAFVTQATAAGGHGATPVVLNEP